MRNSRGAPPRREKRRTRKAACRLARREGASENPLKRSNADATVDVHPGYHDLVSAWLSQWLQVLVALVADVSAAARATVEDLERRENAAALELEAARAKDSVHEPRLRVSVLTLVVEILAVVLGTVTVWGFVAATGLLLPLVLLASLAFALVEVAVAGALGYTLMALHLDEYGSPCELAPRRRRLMVGFAVTFGVICGCLVIGLAIARGGGLLQSAVWLVAGAATAALAAYVGAAVYDSQFERLVARLTTQLHKLAAAKGKAIAAWEAECRRRFALGCELRDLSAGIISVANESLLRAFRAHHRAPDALPPVLAPAALPTNEDIAALLFGQNPLDLRKPSDGPRPLHSPGGPQKPTDPQLPPGGPPSE